MTNREHLKNAFVENFDKIIEALIDEHICFVADTRCQDCPFDQFCATNFGPNPDYQIEVDEWMEQEPVDTKHLYNRI